jgi:hypothetical protein
MKPLRESAFICLFVASALVGPACGRDGLWWSQAPGGEGSGAVTARRSFFLPNNLTPKWAAYQDGSGPWLPIQPIEEGGREYQLLLSDPSRQLGFAIASDLGPEYCEVVVSFLTVDDCLHGVDLETSAPNQLHTQSGNIFWSVAGLANSEHGTVSLAGQSFDFDPAEMSMNTGANSNWPSSGDLLATAGPASGLPTRMIIRRSLRLTDGMTIPTIDFSSAEAFPLQADHVTITGAPIADESYEGVYLTTAGGRILTSQWTQWTTTPATTVPFMAAPAAKLAAGDLYEAVYMGHSSAGNVTVSAYFHSPTGHALAIPGIPSGAKVSNSGGPGDVRLTAEWPATKPGAIRHAHYTQGPDMMHLKWWQVTVSPSYTGGAVTVPDLRTVSGWNGRWDLVVGTTTNWGVGSSISSSPDSIPHDGALEVSIDQRGTIVP